MERRDFIRNSTLAALMPSLWMMACKVDKPIPVIDTHQHLWDLEKFPLRWVRPPLDRNYLMEDYLEAVAGKNVVKAIYMEVAVAPEQREEEANWALGLCEDHDNPTVAAVIAKDPFDENFATYMESFDENPNLKGIRHFFKNESEILDKKVIESLTLLGDMGFSFDLGMRPRWLATTARLIDACPGTPFVLNHCGAADPVAFFPEGKERPRKPEHDRDKWIRDIEAIAQRPNVICKISGIAAHVPDFPLTAADLAPIINHCLDQFGPDRVIFAGDWPVVLRNMPLGRWIDTLMEVVAERPYNERLKLFHDNAVKFYNV